jgi:hypothetical protein
MMIADRGMPTSGAEPTSGEATMGGGGRSGKPAAVHVAVTGLPKGG